MTKWADFGVFRVKYNDDHSAIVELEIRADQGTAFGEAHRVARSWVVDAIERGRTFVTSHLANNKYQRGEDVRV
ncbi:MAG: hypothetical protein R3B72_51200, partial [Polyangiaceae bacterium]